LAALPTFLRLQPDCRPDTEAVAQQVRATSRVSYFPLELPPRPVRPARDPAQPLHIVWPHRWEHDKDPEQFLRAVTELAEHGLNFTVSMLGEQYSEEPDGVVAARAALGEERVEQWGRLQDRNDYLTLLARADVVVSTARHEFYGVAVLEAAWLGCFPLLPASLVYPELYPSECLYRTERQLVRRLAGLCGDPSKLDWQPGDTRVDWERVAGPAVLADLVTTLSH